MYSYVELNSGCFIWLFTRLEKETTNCMVVFNVKPYQLGIILTFRY
jgi:hypothetical protein